MPDKYALSSESREQQARDAAQHVFATLSNKWTLPILEACGDGRHRFTALHRALDGISFKMLTQTLRSMEREGLVDRFDYASANPRVEYNLSPAGRDLLSTVHSLCAWSSRHLDELRAAADVASNVAAERNRR